MKSKHIVYFVKNVCAILLVVLLFSGCKSKGVVIEDYQFKNYRELTGSTYFSSPTTGDVKALVIPVKFKNVNVDKYKLSDLEEAFNGNPETSSKLGWESLNSFYKKSSFGKLNIEATITDWYETYADVEYYIDSYTKNGGGATNEILEDALTDLQYEYDLSEYDSDNDGVLDAIYLIYGYDSNPDVESLFWDWCGTYYNQLLWGDKTVYPYVWLSFYSFYSDNSFEPTDKINSSVLIHETGHVIGAPDYYDSDLEKGANYSIGRYDMMYANIGDHNSTTKMLYGWTKPKIFTDGKMTFELDPFSSSGDSIIICPNFDNNIATEFFIIDYYTFEGLWGDYSFLDLLDEKYKQNDKEIIVDKEGIRIYHVNASMTSIPYSPYAPSAQFDYNNSTTDKAFMGLVTKGENEFLKSLGYWSADCLFTAGEEFVPDKTYTEYGSLITKDISIKVDKIENGKATVTIQVK